ncbi:MAG TPA: hypothetical protein PK295_00540 [Candidatus Magasanikbacteria bacterium]|nr:hypothetical protein [Candidatus Magasanikbacteria bacterium]
MGFFGKEKTGEKNNSLNSIEKRLLEIEEEKPRRIDNLQENYSASFEDEMEAMDIGYLDVEKAQLQTKRQFILDRRDSWKSKIVWNMLVPIVVSVITAYFVTQ